MSKEFWIFTTGVFLALLLLSSGRKEPSSSISTRTEFTPTLVAAYQELKKEESITGREYLALNEMVREKEQTQLKEVAALVNESTQEINAFLSDTEAVLVIRQSPWDGSSTHHL